MQLMYEDSNILGAVELNKADITDSAGGRADSMELIFNDSDTWSRWNPKKNDRIQIIDSGFDTGVMYADELEQRSGLFIIRALPFPQSVKERNTKGWENVRFTEIVREITNKHGFKLQAFGIEDHFYNRIDQNEQADLKFLSFRCILEGYVLKISAGKVIIYNESYMENQASARTINKNEFDGRYKFLSTSTHIYAGCRLTYGNYKSNYMPANAPAGPILKLSNIQVTSQTEADRYARNLLRFYNKHEYTGSFTIKKDAGLAAGVNTNITGLGMSDGKYFLSSVVHRLVEGKTSINARRVLEGY
ncbi:phage late control protein D [Oxobacter pfennigii]|uniref:Phage late control protein D n=1 Tax=Oxobacter pfennigii TaxID=36849 RepID=A0A0P8Y6V4_9CLOT|nr:hypothetical protein [Oxobacter pfennigii]KPU42155.1 phage late control protein D [Oxobacter pfennigii]